jgi:hypothetical protein
VVRLQSDVRSRRLRGGCATQTDAAGDAEASRRKARLNRKRLHSLSPRELDTPLAPRGFALADPQHHARSCSRRVLPGVKSRAVAGEKQRSLSLAIPIEKRDSGGADQTRIRKRQTSLHRGRLAAGDVRQDEMRSGAQLREILWARCSARTRRSIRRSTVSRRCRTVRRSSTRRRFFRVTMGYRPAAVIAGDKPPSADKTSSAMGETTTPFPCFA